MKIMNFFKIAFLISIVCLIVTDANAGLRAVSGVSPGNGVPGGTDGQMQYNNNGSFGGVSKVPLSKGGTNADLGATGGTSYVLQQSSTGAAVTVGQLATSDLSDFLNDNTNSNMFSSFAFPSSITTANNDTAFGNYALQQVTTGGGETLMGSSAGYNITTGNQNTGIGNGALGNVTTGIGNTAIGDFISGGTLVTGNYNILIGKQSSVTGSGAVNQIAIGYQTTAPADNTAIIGNSSTTDIYFGDNTAVLHAVGTNITGTAASLTAGLATATVSQTGTGTTYATSASPTFTGTLTAAAITSTNASTHAGQATCWTTSGVIGYCTSVVGVGGACSCTGL